MYDRDYGWNDNGDRARDISGPRQTREYGYSATGRLESVRTLAPDLDIRIPYATDPAGNRLPDRSCTRTVPSRRGADNRIAEDAHYVYHYDDEYGRLTEKTDLIPAGVIRTDDERTHHTTTTTASTVWCSTRGYSMASHWSRAATSTTRWDGEWRNGYGGGSVT